MDTDGKGLTPRISSEAIQTLMRIRAQEVDRWKRLLPTYMKIAALFNPPLADFDEYNDEMEAPPDYRSVYDNVGIADSVQLADGIQSRVFGRGSAWQRLQTEDPDLMKREDAKVYLQQMVEIFYDMLAHCSYYDEGRNAIRICADFGTATMFRTYDKAAGRPSYKALHPKRALIMEDPYGNPDTLFRDLWLDAYNAVVFFGRTGTPRSALPEVVQKAYEKGLSSKFLFHQLIFPIEKFDIDIEGRGLTKMVSKNESRGKPFYSLYVFGSGQNEPITEGGYWYRPFFSWRWSRNPDGSPYGVDCPGLLEVSNVSQLNGMRQDWHRLIQLAARPMWKATDGLQGGIANTPNGVTFLKPGQDFARANTQGDIRPLLEDMDAIRQDVHISYHRALFRVLTENIDRAKTATEVQGIEGEQAALLTAFYGRMALELLEASAEDLYQLIIDNGHAPPLPDSLKGRIVKIDLVNNLAMAQRRYLSLQPARQWIGEIIGMAQGFEDPGIKDNIKIEEYIRKAGEMYNVDRTIIRDIMEVHQRQAIRQRMQMAQAQAQIQATQADAYSKTRGAAIKAPEPGSPLATRVA